MGKITQSLKDLRINIDELEKNVLDKKKDKNNEEFKQNDFNRSMTRIVLSFVTDNFFEGYESEESV